MDPVSLPLEELIPIWQEIIKKKSMIITGTFSKKDLELMISKLDGSGLFLDIIILDE